MAFKKWNAENEAEGLPPVNPDFDYYGSPENQRREWRKQKAEEKTDAEIEAACLARGLEPVRFDFGYYGILTKEQKLEILDGIVFDRDNLPPPQGDWDDDPPEETAIPNEIVHLKDDVLLHKSPAAVQAQPVHVYGSMYGMDGAADAMLPLSSNSGSSKVNHGNQTTHGQLTGGGWSQPNPTRLSALEHSRENVRRFFKTIREDEEQAIARYEAQNPM